MPKFDLLLVPLVTYIYIGNVASCRSWELAKSRGVTKLAWEIEQERIAFIESEMSAVGVGGTGHSPILMIIRWEESINHHTLYLRFLDQIQPVYQPPSLEEANNDS